MLDVVAKLTGTTTADVQTKRAAGKTFAQIAAEKNVSSSAVVAEALKVRESLLAEKVADGTITQAQADAALGNMKTRLTDRVNTANADCDGTGAGGGGRAAAWAAVAAWRWRYGRRTRRGLAPTAPPPRSSTTREFEGQAPRAPALLRVRGPSWDTETDAR